MSTLPAEFKERMLHILGQDEYLKFAHSLSETPPVSVRINTGKTDFKPALEPVPWCGSAYYLQVRPLFAADPLWHAGAYYVQEASSMVLEQAFKAIRQHLPAPIAVLDLCAAPGGKSTHIASMLTDEDVLVSNEVIRTRVGVLHENLTKWCYPNTIITNADSKDFEPCGPLFDIIVVDAPCSGEGLFRKDEQAIREWSMENTNLCTLRQKRILDQILHCLKPGGYLIYSTCTYNPTENELQIQALTRQGYAPFAFSFNGSTQHMHQCYPHQIKGEGFFIAALQKPENENTQSPKAGTPLKPVKDSSAFSAFLKHESAFYRFKNDIVALSENTKTLLEQLTPFVNCYSAGIKVCEHNDKLLIPSEFLPFATSFNHHAFEIKTLDYETALQYLGKQALPHRSGNKGFVALQYENIHLGLGKLAGNRINNLFPNEWRLRRSVKKEEYFSLLPMSEQII